MNTQCPKVAPVGSSQFIHSGLICPKPVYKFLGFTQQGKAKDVAIALLTAKKKVFLSNHSICMYFCFILTK
jgi:hypothetical protein